MCRAICKLKDYGIIIIFFSFFVGCFTSKMRRDFSPSSGFLPRGDFNRKLAYSFTKCFAFRSTSKELEEEQKLPSLWLFHQKLTCICRAFCVRCSCNSSSSVKLTFSRTLSRVLFLENCLHVFLSPFHRILSPQACRSPNKEPC